MVSVLLPLPASGRGSGGGVTAFSPWPGSPRVPESTERPDPGTTMPYLIDGYNLLHAMGLLATRSPRRVLERARANLLQRLRSSQAPEAAGVTVVFDAAGAPPGAPGDLDHGKVRFLFAQGQTADDLIEDLVRRA